MGLCSIQTLLVVEQWDKKEKELRLTFLRCFSWDFLSKSVLFVCPSEGFYTCIRLLAMIQRKKRCLFLLLDRNSKIKGKSSGNPSGITSKIMKNWPQMFGGAEGLKEIGECVTVTTYGKKSEVDRKMRDFGIFQSADDEIMSSSWRPVVMTALSTVSLITVDQFYPEALKPLDDLESRF